MGSLSKISHAVIAVLALSAAVGMFSSPSLAAEVEFMFSGEGVKGLGQQTAHVKIGESLKISELKERFSGYETILSNECDGFCIIISKGAHSISVFYDQDERTISRIEGWCSASGGLVDQGGAQCGDAISAVSNNICESGETGTCESKALAGLKYFVGEGDRVGGFTVQATESRSSAAEASVTPVPGDYRVNNLYRGKTLLPDFKRRDRDFNTYRTRIRDGMREGPNYAGRYSVIQIGCGTGCSFVIVGDNKTGRPMNFPRGGDDNLYLQLQYQLDSRLMTAQWADQNGGKCYIEFFDFDGRDWQTISKVEIGVTDACFKEIAENLR